VPKKRTILTILFTNVAYHSYL